MSSSFYPQWGETLGQDSIFSEIMDLSNQNSGIRGYRWSTGGLNFHEGLGFWSTVSTKRSTRIL